MKSFKQFLSEGSTDLSKGLTPELRGKIAEYLGTMDNSEPLVRGIKRAIISDAEPVLTIDTGIESNAEGVNVTIKIFEFKILTSRKPVSMNDRLAKRVDDWFESKYGKRFRETSMFCVSSAAGLAAAAKFVNTYGIPCAVAPIGEFTYAWSPEYDDLYFVLSDDRVDDNTLHQDLEAGQYKINQGINDVPPEHEIMVQATSYLAAAVFTGRTPHGYISAEEAAALAQVFWS